MFDCSAVHQLSLTQEAGGEGSGIEARRAGSLSEMCVFVFVCSCSKMSLRGVCWKLSPEHFRLTGDSYNKHIGEKNCLMLRCSLYHRPWHCLFSEAYPE